jgi:hypothetical protein
MPIHAIVSMRTLLASLLVAVLGLGFSFQGAVAQDGGGEQPGLIKDRVKLGQTGMQFLSVSVDPRAASLGNTSYAREMGAASMFYNPAAVSRMSSTLDVHLGQMQWISDISHNYGALAFRPGNGEYGTVGVTLRSVDYGRLLETIRADNQEGFLDMGTYSPTALAVGLGYGRSLTDRFSVGANLKIAHQSLGASAIALDTPGDYTGGVQKRQNSVTTPVVDFGVLYDTGYRSLTFGATVRNFSQEVTYARESFELPLAFSIAGEVDAVDFLPLSDDRHTLNVAVRALTPRSNVEQVGIGAEYIFLNTIAVRTGYHHPTERGSIRLGAGIQQNVSGLGFNFDYAYQTFESFNAVHRLVLGLNL